MIIPAQDPKTGMPSAMRLRSGSASPKMSISFQIVVDSPPGMIRPVDRVQLLRPAHRDGLAPDVAQRPQVLGDVALQRRARRPAAPRRPCSRRPCSRQHCCR